MNERITGLHHVTAIASGVQTNYDFYTRILGLRLVKRTVNFDDPSTYHLYYGNDYGEPGTILTFFPWLDLPPGEPGVGQVSRIQLLIPTAAVPFWLDRFRVKGVNHRSPLETSDQTIILFSDRDGLPLELIARDSSGSPNPAVSAYVPEAMAIRGLYGVTLTLQKPEPTLRLLTDVFGYVESGQVGDRTRLCTPAGRSAASIDIVAQPAGGWGQIAGGSVHHVAFRVGDKATQRYYQQRLQEQGYQTTPVIDRDYFQSVYFREPGGVLFEIATDSPGFTADEELAELGKHLQLPKRYEPLRKQLEQSLPPLVR